MKPHKDLKAQPGSLEAALRELNAAPEAEATVPSHPEDPGTLRPGDHTPASPRFVPPAGDPPGYTLWGRCGYVPSRRDQPG
jgi:hypothetical protein